jgi:outer membrane protein assembly factor BamB
MSVLSILLIGCSNLDVIKKKIVTPKRETRAFKALWGKNLDPQYLSGNVPIHLNGPTLHDGAIYIGATKRGFMSLDERNGDVLWSISENESYNSTATIYEDSVIYGTESGRIISRKLINGELNYELDLGASVDGSPITSKGRLFVQLRNHQIFSLDATTGKILWSYKKSVTNKTTIQGVGRGHVHKNLVIFGFADGDVLGFRVETGDVIWEQKIGQSNDKFMDLNWGMHEYNGYLATVDAAGILYFLQSSDGSIFRQLNVGASTNLHISENILYFGDASGNLKSVDSSFNVQTLAKISKRSLTRVGRFKNELISGDIDGLLSSFSLIDKKVSGQRLLGNDLSALFRSPKIGHHGGLVVFTSRGRLYYYY